MRWSNRKYGMYVCMYTVVVAAAAAVIIVIVLCYWEVRRRVVACGGTGYGTFY